MFWQGSFWLDSACSADCSSTSRFQHPFPSISGHSQQSPSQNCCYLLLQLLFLEEFASAAKSPSPCPATADSRYSNQHHTVISFSARNWPSLTWTLSLSSKISPPRSVGPDQSPWWVRQEPSFRCHFQIQEWSEVRVATWSHAEWCPLSYSHRITSLACIFRSTEASVSAQPCRSTVLFGVPTALPFRARPFPQALALFRTIGSCCAWFLLLTESLPMIFFRL